MGHLPAAGSGVYCDVHLLGILSFAVQHHQYVDPVRAAGLRGHGADAGHHLRRHRPERGLQHQRVYGGGRQADEYQQPGADRAGRCAFSLLFKNKIRALLVGKAKRVSVGKGGDD